MLLKLSLSYQRFIESVSLNSEQVLYYPNNQICLLCNTNLPISINISVKYHKNELFLICIQLFNICSELQQRTKFNASVFLKPLKSCFNFCLCLVNLICCSIFPSLQSIQITIFVHQRKVRCHYIGVDFNRKSRFCSLYKKNFYYLFLYVVCHSGKNCCTGRYLWYQIPAIASNSR